MIKLLSKLVFSNSQNEQSDSSSIDPEHDRYALWHALPERHLVIFIDTGILISSDLQRSNEAVEEVERLLCACPSVFLVFVDSTRVGLSRAHLTALFKAEYFDRLLGITQDFSKGQLHHPRAEECQEFVFMHRVKNYLVLDTDLSKYPQQFPPLILMKQDGHLTDDILKAVTDRYSTI